MKYGSSKGSATDLPPILRTGVSGFGPLEFEVDWADIAKGGVTTGSVIADFDVFENRTLDFNVSL